MQKNEFKEYFESLMEKHMPVYFMDYKSIRTSVDSICKIKNLSRRHILILAYIIGATEEECNKLLETKGYSKLYVKKREDAIWTYALNNHVDSETVVKKYFYKMWTKRSN